MRRVLTKIKAHKTLFLLGVTVLIAAVYLVGLAGDRFTSESRFTVKSQSEGAAASGLDLGILGGTSAAKQDQLIIRDYLTSHDMMKMVVEEFGLEMISGPQSDPVRRLSKGSAETRKLTRYRWLIDYTYDEEASVSTLITQGYSPSAAEELNTFLLEKAETYINDFSRKNSRNFIDFAQNDVQTARDRVAAVRQEIRATQTENEIVDPETDIKVVASTLTEIEAELTKQRSELNNLLSYLHEDTHQVEAKKNTIRNLESQRAELRERLSGKTDKDLAEASVAFKSLESELEFANANYASAMKTLEAARMQAMQSRKYLMIIEEPDVPDFATYPRVLIDLGMVAAVVLMFLLLARTMRVILK